MHRISPLTINQNHLNVKSRMKFQKGGGCVIETVSKAMQSPKSMDFGIYTHGSFNPSISF